jgi:hypothetical protein
MRNSYALSVRCGLHTEELQLLAKFISLCPSQVRTFESTLFAPSRKTYINIKQRYVKILLENLPKDSTLQKAYMRGEYGIP